MSSPEVMAIAHQLTVESVALAEEIGSTCFDQNSELSTIAATILARATQSLLSTDLLARHGLVGDAMSCSRTAVELAIDFAYIANDVTILPRFMAYGGVHHHKLAKNVAKHGGVVPPDVMAELQRQRDEFKADNGAALGNWAGVTLSERATKGGREVLYNLSYVDQCNASHSGAGTLFFTQLRVDDGLVVNFGPVAPSSHPVVLAVTAITVLIADVAKACGLTEAFAVRLFAITERVSGIFDPSRGLARYSPAS